MKKLLLSLFIALTGIMQAQPVITQNPQSITLCDAQCDTLLVVANGTSLSYEWQFLNAGNWSSFTGATSSQFGICGDITNDSILVRCIVTDGGGLSDTSNTAQVSTDSCLAPKADFEFVTYGDSVCFESTSLRATTVLWNFGNGGQSSAFNPCYDYQDYQIFYVKLYAYNEYGVDVIEKEVDLLSIDELSTNFRVYPNPAVNEVIIESDDVFNTIEVIDLVGNKVELSLEYIQQNRVNLSELPRGVYFLVVHFENDTQFERIILE